VEEIMTILIRRSLDAAVVLSLVVLAGCGGGSAALSDLGAPVPDRVATRCGDPAERPWCDPGLNPAERTTLLLAEMTLMQKIELLAGDDPVAVASGDPYVGIVNGIPELGIPDLRMSDGPVGVRGSPATAMPIPLALAASFNPELAYRTGAAIGNEVRNKGNDLLHAPVGDLVRNPLAGRTFETFGEDVHLATRLTVAWTRGAQHEGVLANPKHYLMNTQEGIVGVPPLTAVVGGRQTVNAVVDARTLRETYLPPFEAAVKEADAASIMCAYNFVNGPPACGSAELLESILRQDWDFDGFVLTDYVLGAKDTVGSLNNGTEIEMPIGIFYQPMLVQAAVLGGLVSMETIDRRVGNLLRTLFRFGFFDRADYVRNDDLIDREAHAAVARETAEQGMVLLENDGLLPLSPALKRIAVIGAPAVQRPSGGGSSSVTPFAFTTPLDALIARAGPEVEVLYNDGRDAEAAAALAESAEVALVFVADRASEGVDKLCLKLDCSLADYPDSLLLNALGEDVSQTPNTLLDPLITGSTVGPILEQLFAPLLLSSPLVPVSHRNQDGLIEAIAAAQPRTAVVMQTSGAVLTPWRDRVAALLAAWYPGQEGGFALARVLFGDTDPGGRLPISFPQRELDTPVAGRPERYPGLANQAQHSEGIFIGYRWHDQQGIAPAYPFGFGRSYTRFELEDLSVRASDEGSVEARARVRNTGARAGWAVPQLYAGLPSPGPEVPQPEVALKGFDKHWLQPGEARELRFRLSPRDLSYWDVTRNDWQQASGCYRFWLGLSSRERPLTQALPLGGGTCDTAAF
jgi:beta-glucosidase